MAKTQYELLVEQANKPRKPQTIQAINMDYNPTSFSGNSGNGLGFSAPSARRNTNTGYVGSVINGGTKKTGSSTAQMIANADPYMDEQTRNVINSTQETFSKVRKPKQMKNSFNDTLNYKPSSTAWQTNGESSLYGFSGGSYKPSTPTITPMDEEEEYVYTGPNYMDQLRSLYNSLYGSNIDAANSAYAQLKAEAERQALIKKGQAHTRKVTMGKYVPETLRAMGLKNNGLAADALIGIDNNYMNYLMQALAQEENAKAEASRYLAEQTRAANAQKAAWEIDLLGRQQDAWTMMQQMALSGNYDETALQNFGYSWGFDKDQVGSTLDIYKNVLAKEEAEKAASAKLLENQEIETLLTNALGYNYSRDALITIAKQKGISEEGIKNMLSEYDLIYADYNNTTEITEENERIAVDMQAYGVTNNSKAVNPKVMTSAAMYDYLDVAEGKAQGDYIDRIFEVSKNWDNSMNGTFVNFNYGLNFGGLRNVFVFYNGKWYKTNLDAAGIQARSADGKFYANNFDFYKKFGK